MKWFLLAYVVISVLLFDPKLHLGGDEAVYIILSESIATGQGYRDLQLVGHPQHRTFPPGLPITLSLFTWLFGRNVVLLKCVIILFGVGGYVYYMKLTRHFLPPLGAAVASVAYLLTPLIHYNHYVLSEIPFVFFALGAIYWMVRHE